MGPLAPVLSVVSGLFGLYSGYQQYKAAGEAEDIARDNAGFQRAETAEQARRLSAQQEAQESAARARVAASGLAAGGSPGRYIDRLTAENQRELAWLQRAGESQADIMEQEGRSARRTGEAAAFGTLGKTAGSFANWI